MPLTLTLNGHGRDFDNLASPATVAHVIIELGLKDDRVAVELNGEIVARSQWPETPVTAGDRLEIVHFVGGGRL